jgi:predicted GH43/DUF377 family glycosyl hydrolase
MKWEKKGLVFEACGQHEWLQTHAQLPVADILSNEIVRVYFAGRNKKSYSSIGFVDLAINDNFRVVKLSTLPVLSPGDIGYFDEHGVFPASIINFNNKKYLYYIGWNQGSKAPMFYASIGLAVSDDDGNTFRKISKAPIMSRSEFDPCLVTSPNILIDNDLLRMTYVSGVKWEYHNEQLKSFYHIKYAESKNGINWERNGLVCVDFRDEKESNIARSSVLKEDGIYKMWYCYVYGDVKYRMGYAESTDFKTWKRLDGESFMDVSSNGFDTEMTCYPNVVIINGKKHMFYNGNNFGKQGFGLAIEND